MSWILSNAGLMFGARAAAGNASQEARSASAAIIPLKAKTYTRRTDHGILGCHHANNGCFTIKNKNSIKIKAVSSSRQSISHGSVAFTGNHAAPPEPGPRVVDSTYPHLAQLVQEPNSGSADAGSRNCPNGVECQHRVSCRGVAHEVPFVGVGIKPLIQRRSCSTPVTGLML